MTKNTKNILQVPYYTLGSSSSAYISSNLISKNFVVFTLCYVTFYLTTCIFLYYIFVVILFFTTMFIKSFKIIYFVLELELFTCIMQFLFNNALIFFLLGLFTLFIYNYKFKLFDVRSLVFSSVILRVILMFLGYIFMDYSWVFSELYYIFCLLILYSFLESKKKLEFFSKLIFLFLFWGSLFIVIENLINYYSTFDSSLEVFVRGFLIYYAMDNWDFYSKLNEENSKHILDALHDIIKNINFKDYTIFPKGSGGSGGEFDPYPSLANFGHLFIDKDEPEFNFRPNRPKLLVEWFDTKFVKHLSDMLDKHNNNLVFPTGKDMTIIKNLILSNNAFLDYGHHNPYGMPLFTADITGFFHFYSTTIMQDVDQYNWMLASKYFYECKDKNIIPKSFEILFRNWQFTQTVGTHKYIDFLIKNPNDYFPNFFNKTEVYNELMDNILIIGLGIICKTDVLNKLHYDYITDYYPEYEKWQFIDKKEFYEKAWNYYQESLQKYYMFFSHYNWYCKLYDIETNTKIGYYKALKDIIELTEGLKSIPPLNTWILDSWTSLPDWFNNVRPDNYLSNKHDLKFIRTMFKDTFDWTNMEEFLSLKTLKLKSIMSEYIMREYCPFNNTVTARQVGYLIYEHPIKIKQFYLMPYINEDGLPPKILSASSIKDKIFKEPIKIKDFYFQQKSLI